VGVYPVGNQRVGVGLKVPVLDGNGDPVVSEYGEAEVTETVLWVEKSCFEIQTPTEQQNLTVTTSEIAWAMLPIAGMTIPAVDDDDGEAPIDFLNEITGKPTINSNAWLIHNGMRYEMRGDSVLEQDIHGRADHVFCVCEREEG
jgi:hypothetical protein